MLASRLIVSLALAAAPLLAQPKFEVTSVHLNKTGERRFAVNPSGSRFTATNMSLFSLVQWAYELEDFRISGGPSWLTSTRFDIAADAAGAQSMPQFRVLLQQLLRDRFQLAVHRQSKKLAVYELTVAKGGLKMKEATCVGAPGPANPCGGTSTAGRGKLIGRAVLMAVLAKDLSGMLGRPVLDRTKLKGEFDLDLSWTPDETSRRNGGDPDAVAPVSDGPSVFTAMQEQLGLTLKAAKASVDVLVVDRAELPTEN